jgi:hypothetical protein
MYKMAAFYTPERKTKSGITTKTSSLPDKNDDNTVMSSIKQNDGPLPYEEPCLPKSALTNIQGAVHAVQTLHTN